MVEYGVKKITTNPRLITESEEIVRIVDGRTRKTRAFVIPSTHEKLVERLVREIEDREWARRKKEELENAGHSGDKEKEALEALSEAGMKSVEEYLDDTQG
ncbi:hypothetical protein [Nitratifractor sp.]